MKILVTYFSQSGNTEKIANSIYEGCQGEDVDIKSVKEVNFSTLNECELVFLGSGIYASRVNKSLSDLLKNVSELPSKFAFFCTHSSLDSYKDGFRVVKRKIGDSLKINAEFDCCGENIGIPEAIRKRMLDRLPPNKRKEGEKHQKWLKGRPNEEDLLNAKKFAQSILQNL
ncbi:hypothetical protein LCGC14_1595840 [marine sediment metagenome]|uniref:Flavodoxin-like domain-containing protein n=1 Tax=marine sediment metagenome TaxID=412755 RepID=A0A0F9ICN8_9ZZZZ|nr:MAG: flavodoxin [Candidatus Lokiarchaeum sp. GC14_75]HEA70551.1 hypothetical protein [archaeon]